MSLVSTDELAKNTDLKGLGVLAQPLAYIVHRLLLIHRMNEVYDSTKMYESPVFEGKLLDLLGVSYTVSDEDLGCIPREGPFVVVANHPLGGLDGIILLKIISEIRPDFKIIANFILEKILPLKPKIFPVNPFEEHKDVKNSFSGMKDAYKHLKGGSPLGVFPAGEVSQKDSDGNISDREWQLPIMKLLRRAKVPVVPMYFDSSNSDNFYRFGKWHPDLQSALLPREFLRKRSQPIRVRLGDSIPVSEQESMNDVRAFTDHIRNKTYRLASS